MRSLIPPILAVSFVLAHVPAHAADAQTPPVDLRTFVTSWYMHGLPCADARAYGPQAVPDLVGMLADPSLQPNWVSVIATLGCIGDASAVAPLIGFMQRQQGPVSVDAFRAVLGVLPAIGQIANGGDATALRIVTDFVGPDACKSYGIALVYGRYHDDALAEVLGRMAIDGLGISGRPEALALLKKLSDDPALRPDWRDNVAEAIALNQRVSSVGLDTIFARED